MNYKKIEQAPQINIEQYEDIAEDFIPSIFGINEWLITDKSRLSDFMEFGIKDGKAYRSESAFKIIYEKIRKRYGVDVSDLDYLVEVFQRIRILGNNKKR